MSKKYAILRQHQYGSRKASDELIMFFAKAKDVFSWAGIPRKAWNIRMLFQRQISSTRESELIQFWERAANPTPAEDFIVGPTAIVLALQDSVSLSDTEISLTYEPTINLLGDAPVVLSQLAGLLEEPLRRRLTAEQRDVLDERVAAPFTPFPEIGNDYVFEFALQLQQMRSDATRFIEANEIDQDGQDEMVSALEALTRPAIVVDGQHRLFGAANIQQDVYLPVVAMPHCPWTEQIYQFVVINEKAQKVDTSLLTDIFGSSLTTIEQEAIRRKLARSNVEIEARIAAVIAGRSRGSPFENLVIVRLEGTPPSGVVPYITERTIRVLIDGSNQRYSYGWRSHEEFYEYFVQPTFPLREQWENWTDGKWREYWFAFWSVVRDYYNGLCNSTKPPRPPIWSQSGQTNLTKAVTLRQVQSLFMELCIDNMKKIEANREVLIEMVGDVELAEKKLAEQRRAKAIPNSPEEFRNFVRQNFLENGIPLKVFTTPWKASLDDPQGQLDLWDTLKTAYERCRKGEIFRVTGRIFVADENA